jgi:hypothetical protein
MDRERRSTTRSTRSERNPRAPGRAARQAIDAMVFEGISRDEAAKRAGMLAKSLANSLRKPRTKQYLARQMEVLRTSERARNIHALTAVRDESANAMARVAAVKTLEQISDDPVARPIGPQAPGVCIIISDRPPARDLPPPARVLDVPASLHPANPRIMGE